MSDDEQRKQQNDVDRTSSASSISTDPGPAPHVDMKGDAKSGADRDPAQLDGKTAQLEGQAHADAAVPMGEDHIDTSVPTEELVAKAAPGEVPDVALPTVAGAAPSEEVGIIAQEQSKAEIDAALIKASADMTAERGKHAQADAQARAAGTAAANFVGVLARGTPSEIGGAVPAAAMTIRPAPFE